MVPPIRKEIIGSISPFMMDLVPIEIDINQERASPFPVKIELSILFLAVYITFKVLRYTNINWVINIQMEPIIGLSIMPTKLIIFYLDFLCASRI